MKLRGQFRFFGLQADGSDLILPVEDSIVVPNTVMQAGAQEYMKMVFRADDTLIAAGGNFFIGLCNQIPDAADTLVDITTEPSSAGGYARQPITRDAIGWPTLDVVNGIARVQSTIENFTASGADFSASITRAFLCSVVSGTSGTLFSYSGALTAPVLVADGQTLPVRYEAFFG